MNRTGPRGIATLPRTPRLLAAIAAVVVAAPVSAAPAAAYDRPALLERVASAFALRPAEVRCPSLSEWINDPIRGSVDNPQRALGYTDMLHEHIVLHPTLCGGRRRDNRPRAARMAASGRDAHPGSRGIPLTPMALPKERGGG